jgi:hypothetical protein
MPFANRLDVKIPWLFYQVPSTFPGNIDTVFCDRFWDDKEHWIPDGVGVVPHTLKPYFGKIPPAVLGPLYGTADQWLNGLNYETWIAGGYASTPCWQVGGLRSNFPRTQVLDGLGSEGM